MNSPMEGQAFLVLWIGFLLLMTGCVGAFFFWAVRSGQMSQQDRARYLALQSGIPEEDEPLKESDRESGREAS